MASFSAHWSRRDVLIAASATAAATLLARPSHSSAPKGDAPVQPKAPFRTVLCDLLQIEYPVLQAPMSRIVTPALVAAVSESGGLGILAGIGVPPDALRGQIREVRQRTDRPFGVNLILHTGLLPPVDAARIPMATVEAVQRALNQFRTRLGIPESYARPSSFPDLVDAAIEVILEEQVPVFSIGLGKPTPETVRRFHERGATVIAMAATVADSVELAQTGVDVIIAQGGDAGGHRSTWVKRSSPELASVGTMSLVPQVADAVDQPVVAAGGIMNGRGLVAALSLGATGVLMGTRFIATAESAAPEFYKRALVERDSDSTTLSDAFTGLYARLLRNAFTEEYRASGAPTLPAGIQQIAAADIINASSARQSGAYYPMYAGQGVGMIRDVPEAANVVHAVIEEARREMTALPERVRLS